MNAKIIGRPDFISIGKGVVLEILQFDMIWLMTNNNTSSAFTVYQTPSASEREMVC